MSSEKASALVLRLVDFSETSLITTLFTREFGKIHALAKGARRPKGPFEAALDLLSLCRIVFLRKSTGALDLLTEAKLERRFRPVPRDLSSLYAGYYVAELLNDLTDDSDPHPELFDVAVRTLDMLNRGEVPVGRVLARFELTALSLLGHLPSLENCVECGAAVASEGRVAFGQLAGGVLCRNCRPGKTQVVSLTREALRVMQQLTELESEQWISDQTDRKVLGEVRGVLNQYVAHLLGHRPRMQAFLGILNY